MPNVLFSPGIKFLNKFKYPVKIGIISVVLILFIGGLFYIVTQHIENVIKSTEKQIIGLHYIDPVKNFLQDVQEHRALTTAYLNGEKQLKNEIIEKNKKIQKDIDSVKKVQKEKKSILNIDKKWTQISNEWQYLENNSLNLTSEENFKKHTNLINEILNLIEDIGDLSGLILDSQLNTFYMARSISRNIPELVEYVGEARSFGIGIVTRKKITERERTDLIIQATLIKDNLRRINQNFLIIFSTDKIIKEKVERFLDDITTSTNYFLNMINKELINTDKITISRKDFYMTGAAAINSTYRLYEIELHELEYLLTERINKLKQGKSILFSAVSVALLGLIYIFACFSIALLDSLKTLEETELNIARGNLDAEAAVYSKYDEMGSLSMAFNSMMKNLKMLMEREVILREIILSSLESRNKNQILRSIVDNTGRIFKADRCFFIDYDYKNNEFLPIKSNNVYISSLEFKNLIGKKLSMEEMESYLIVLLQQKQVLVINDVNKIIIPKITRALMEEIQVKSVMAAPIIFSGRLIGLLIIDYVKNLKEFSEDEKKLYETIAKQSAIVINQAAVTEKLQETLKREAVLRKIIQTIRSSLDIESVKHEIVTQIAMLLKADKVAIAYYDYETENYIVSENAEYRSSDNTKSFIGKNFKNISGFVEFIREKHFEGKDIIFNNLEKYLDENNLRGTDIEKFYREFGFASSAAINIYYGEEFLGDLVITFENPSDISEDEINLLRALANQTGVAIYQSKLYETIKKQAESENFLRKIINNILTSENLDKALNLICEEIGELFDAERVKIRNYTNEESFLEAIAEYRKNDQIPSSLLDKSIYPQEMSEYFENLFINEKNNFIINDFEKDFAPDYIKDFSRAMSTKSVIVSPIFYKNQLIANVVIENITSPKEWEKENLDLLTPICEQIAIGINLFNLNEELKKALGNEQILREISDQISILNTYEEVDDYTLNQLLKVFNVERAIHCNFVGDSIEITSEKTSNENIESLKHSWRFTKANLEEIITEPGLFINISNTELEIKNGELKDYLRSQNINSFIIYPTAKMILKEKPVEIVEITMLANSENHIWTESEKNFMKLIIDTVSIINLKIVQKQELEEIKKTFMATLTHDLKSPIIAEQKALEFMISKKFNCSEACKEYLEDIYKTNKSLLKIVNNLLAVYHYESGKPVLNKAETNIKDLIEESVRTLKYLAEDKESQIYFDVEENLPLINIDGDEIARVFSNLIGNAIRHTKKRTQIKVNVVKKNSNILVSIQDNGEGIPKDQIPFIFQRYPAEKRKVGTGLGLYLSKQIIEAHEGKIWFETKEGEGTTFYFTLPI